jgi:hypothetical protein
MSGQRAERDELIAAAAEYGWWAARITARGYVIMRCSCGQHQETVPKTPSNQNTFRNKLRKMMKDCPGGR